jgi:hypothetical protein
MADDTSLFLSQEPDDTALFAPPPGLQDDTDLFAPGGPIEQQAEIGPGPTLVPVDPGYLPTSEILQDQVEGLPPLISPEIGMLENFQIDPRAPREDPNFVEASFGKLMEGAGLTVADTVEGLNVLTLDFDGSDLAARIRILTAYDPGAAYQDDWFINSFMPGLGSAGVFLSGGFAGAGLKAAGAVSTNVARWLIPGFLGAAAGGGGGFHEALEKEATYEQALSSWGLNAAIGTSEAWPIMKIFGRADDALGGVLGKNLAKNLEKVNGFPATGWKRDAWDLARMGARGALEEGLQETFQTIGGNVVASSWVGYDPTRTWTESVWEAGTAGGSVGLLLNTIAGAYGIRLRQTAPRRLVKAVQKEGLIGDARAQAFLRGEIPISGANILDAIRLEVLEAPILQVAGFTEAELLAELGIDPNNPDFKALRKPGDQLLYMDQGTKSARFKGVSTVPYRQSYGDVTSVFQMHMAADERRHGTQIVEAHTEMLLGQLLNRVDQQEMQAREITRATEFNQYMQTLQGDPQGLSIRVEVDAQGLVRRIHDADRLKIWALYRHGIDTGDLQKVDLVDSAGMPTTRTIFEPITLGDSLTDPNTRIVWEAGLFPGENWLRQSGLDPEVEPQGVTYNERSAWNKNKARRDTLNLVTSMVEAVAPRLLGENYKLFISSSNEQGHTTSYDLPGPLKAQIGVDYVFELGINLNPAEAAVVEDGKSDGERVKKAQLNVLQTVAHELGHMFVYKRFGDIVDKFLKATGENIVSTGIGFQFPQNVDPQVREDLLKDPDFIMLQNLRKDYFRWLWAHRGGSVRNMFQMLSFGILEHSLRALPGSRFYVSDGEAAGAGLINMSQAHWLQNVWFVDKKEGLFSFHEYIAQRMGSAFLGQAVGEQETEGLFDIQDPAINNLLEEFRDDLKRIYTGIKQATARGGVKEIELDQTFNDFLRYHSVRGKISKRLGELAEIRIPDKTPVDALQSGGNSLPPGGPNLQDPNAEFHAFNTEQDRFNRFYALAANILQIARVNEHVKPLQDYVDLVDQWSAERSQSQFEVEQTYKAWRALGQEQENILTNILLEESLEEKWLTPQELSERGLSEAGKKVYDKVHEDFRNVLNEMEGVGKEEILRRFPGDPIRQGTEIDALKVKYDQLRRKPYFPFMRFGRHAIKLLDADGKQVWFGTFESKKASPLNFFRKGQQEALSEWRKVIRQNPDMKGWKAVEVEMSDFDAGVQSFPGDFAKLVSDRMKALKIDLTKDQEEALQNLAYEKSVAKGFLKRFIKRKGVAGYSRDGLRVYASYMSSAINFLARVKYAPLLNEEVERLRKQDSYIKKISPGAGEASDLSKRGEIANWLDRHLKYVMSPSNELAALRSGVFTWFLGFNVKSAALNSTQILYTTYPYLAARFGSDTGTARALVRAMKYQTVKKAGGEGLNLEWERLLAQGVQESWLDEGLASNLAVYTKSDRIQRVFPRAKDSVQSFLLNVPKWSAFMFHGVEKFNRNITALAAYQLARESGLDETASIREAKNAVRRTQYEYARWNRPEFMRGKKSIIFVFQNYVQNMLWFSTREQGAMRYWFIQAILAGALGLPGAEDFLDLIDTAWPSIRKHLGFKGPYKSAYVEMRKLVNAATAELNINPDILLHGVSRQTMGLQMVPILDRMPMPRFDLSGSLSMGDILPGTEILRGIKNGNLDQILARGTADVAGATGSAVYNTLRAVFDNDPDQWKRWERALPSAGRNASKALRLAARGQEATRQGGIVAEFNVADTRDRADLLFLAMGFQPTKLSEGWEEKISQIQHVEYYRKWKTELLTDYNYTLEIENREGQADVMKAIKEYNRLVPFPEMAIKRETLRQSHRSYRRTRARSGRNIALQNEYIRLQRDVSEAFVGSGELDSARKE